MKGPVKMFVAEALDEMMAGDPADDAIEPLYVSVLAPDNGKPGETELGVMLPDIFIVVAEVHDTAAADVVAIRFPFIFNDVPEKLIPEAAAPVILPITVRVPADCNIAFPVDPTIFPNTLVSPVVELRAYEFAILPPLILPVIVKVPVDDLSIQFAPLVLAPLKLFALIVRLQFPLWFII
jgi:hypothetical protein